MVDTEPGKCAMAYIMKSSTEKLTAQQVLVVCDFLIVRILLENGQWPGPLETAHVLDFERLHSKDDCFIMYVSQHKTSKAGPAPLTLPPNLKTNLEAYIMNIRSLIAKEDDQALFVTANRTAFTTGTISN